MARILVAVATYNEVENLPSLVDEIFRAAPQVDLLVVDDNSPDGTGRWCQQQAAREPRLRLIERAGKLGHGSAIVAAMHYAIEKGYDYLLTMDADFSHHPRYIPALLAGMEGADAPAADIMIGSRYVPGGGVEGWPWRRRMMSLLVNGYARALLRLPARDCSGGFRCYRVAQLAAFDFSRPLSRGYSFHEEILWRLARQGCRIGETPITFVNRTHGHSKINAREAITTLWIIFRSGLGDRFGRR